MSAAANFYETHLLNSVLSDLGIIAYSVTGLDFPPTLAPILNKLVAEFN